MPTPSKKTDLVMRRVLELRAKGAGVREIARDIGCTHRTVARWLEEAGLPLAPAPTPSVAEQAARELVVRESFAGSAIDVVRERLGSVRATLDRLTRALERGEVGTDLVTALARLETELANELAKIEASTKAEDARVAQEAEAEVEAKLARLVLDAEREARCVHCRRPPFRSAA